MRKVLTPRTQPVMARMIATERRFSLVNILTAFPLRGSHEAEKARAKEVRWRNSHRRACSSRVLLHYPGGLSQTKETGRLDGKAGKTATASLPFADLRSWLQQVRGLFYKASVVRDLLAAIAQT